MEDVEAHILPNSNLQEGLKSDQKIYLNENNVYVIIIHLGDNNN